jgi:hypothetical protein
MKGEQRRLSIMDDHKNGPTEHDNTTITRTIYEQAGFPSFSRTRWAADNYDPYKAIEETLDENLMEARLDAIRERLGHEIRINDAATESLSQVLQRHGFDGVMRGAIERRAHQSDAMLVIAHAYNITFDTASELYKPQLGASYNRAMIAMENDLAAIDKSMRCHFRTHAKER